MIKENIPMTLTTRQVTKLTEPGRYGDGRGLYLQVTPTGARSWLLRYERGGRERAMGLGPVDDFTLDQARERARKARQLLKDGIDPLEARKDERAKQTSEEGPGCCRQRHLSGMRGAVLQVSFTQMEQRQALRAISLDNENVRVSGAG
jgi:hypothetical protein